MYFLKLNKCLFLTSKKSNQNEFGFEAERLKACSAAKRMSEILIDFFDVRDRHSINLTTELVEMKKYLSFKGVLKLFDRSV